MLRQQNNQLVIRPALASDAPAIAGLFEQLGYPDAGDGLAARLAGQLDNESARILVADRPTQTIAGVLVMHVFAPLHVARPWAVISSLVVDQETRSNGAGAALMQAAEGLARAAGCAHLELSCSAHRTRAHQFYEAQGFVEVRKRMKKQLS